MRLEQLKYFISIADTRSINKTSLEFFTTHQGISKAIRQLEDEMGVPLFTRSSKGMTLTQEGELFLPVARHCVQELHAIHLKLLHRKDCGNLDGRLQLWGTPLTNSLVLPALVEDFSVIHPKVHYQITEANSLHILKQVSLQPNTIGLVIVLHDPALQDIYAPYLHQVQHYPLQQDEYVCLASKNTSIAARKSISFAEFCTHPIAALVPDASSDHPVRQLLKKLGNIDLAFATSTPHLCAQAINSGKYLSLSSRRSRTEISLLDDSNVAIIPFDEDLTLDIMLVTNPHPDLDPVTQAFVDLVREQAKE